MQWSKLNYLLTTNPREDSARDTYLLLQKTYWSHKRPLDVVEKTIDNSLCFFLFDQDRQIGFARIITDYATTSWLADVVLDDSYQNQKLGSWMMNCVLDHPDISFTQFVLQTGSAEKFYSRLGFSKHPSLMSTEVDYL